MALETIHNETSFGVGDVIRVHQLIEGKQESDKGSRTQVFEGTVMGIRGRGNGKSFVVRRIGEQKVGIEMIYPLHSPIIEKIEVVREGKRGARQGKLYYTRHKSPREIETIYSRAKRRTAARASKTIKEAKKPVKKASAKMTTKKK
jgi:large subunit ribosomal protein L19